MYKGRAAAALLALAACVACSSAAPTASDHTALDLHEGPKEGCYYNFQHYGEGDRIMTNEPCLNCTCHNRMLMCYLRVCPFTKAIGQDCTVEKRADQCCPIVTCPDVPVDLLTSTSTSSPAEYGPTGMGKLDKYGCSINGKYFPEGSKVPPSPNKPCEHCYCIRNMTTCVMQECTLHVDGCTPIYHKDVCCPVRYSCDHAEDEIPLLDDMTTTVRPTPGFLLTTTTTMPVTQMTQDCVHDEQIFRDGASIKTDKACEHCYCMKGDIVCVVQECGTPMENEGKNCTSLPPRQGQCCPDTYICEGDEPTLDITTEATDLTSAPPRRVGVEGSGYRNEPDEPFTERGPFENEIEGSGDTSETDTTSKISPDPGDELLLSTTEKEDQFSQSTEEDKGFNTIPDAISEKEPSVTNAQDSYQSTEPTSTEAKATVADEFVASQDITSKHEEDIITTEASFHPQEIDKIVPIDTSKQEPISTTIPELTTSKDKYFDNTVTETTYAKKETEQVPESTESMTLNDVATTESSAHPVTEKHMVEDDMSSTSKIETGVDMTTNIISSITEQNEQHVELSTLKEINIVEDITTISNIQELPETTSINPVDNEVDYIPARIPGEGDCLLNGITYGNNSIVPSTNNCHSGCRCVSSIIKCDPIICSPPPEYMENMNDCQTSYDTPDACCPTYICNAKETSLPQSHSQTSVTESSKPIDTIECNGNDCNLGEEKQPPHNICESGNCDSGSKQNDCGINGCQDEQSPLETPEGCSGDKCSVSPIIPCEGENCVSSAPKDDDVDKNIPSVSSKEPICTDGNGCNDTRKEEDCNEESCRRKETSETESKVPAECSGAECKIGDEQNVPAIEQASTPSTDKIFNENTPETSVEHITPSEKTPISEPSAELSTELPPTKVDSLDTESSSAKTMEEITTELPVKLETGSETNIPVDIDSHKEMDIPKEESNKSEKQPEEFIPTPEDNATEYTKTNDDESSTEKVIYDQTTGIEKTEAVTESKLADKTVANKDISQEYTTEAVQISTQESGSQSEIYETKQDESFTKLPIVMDDEKEKHVTEMPNEIEVKVTTESEYDQPTAEEQEKIHIVPQPTKIQESMTTEIPERLSTVSVEDVNKITSGEQAVTTEQIEDNKTERITSPEVDTTQHPLPVKTEEQPIETVTSDSNTSYDKDLTVDHDTYTQSPHPSVTESEKNVDSDSLLTTSLEESDNQVKEFSTPSSVTKENEKLATHVDAILPEDDSKTEDHKYETSTESEPLQHVDKNDGFGEKVTEKQITETEQETYTQVPQEATEKTKLDISTESNKESDMQPIVDKELQTLSPFDAKEPTTNQVKDVPVTESSHYDTSDSQTEIGDKISEFKTTTQDISILKETSMMTDEVGNESFATDKSIIKTTSPSSVELPSIADTQDSDVTQSEVLTTQLPKEIVEEGYPTKDTQSTKETNEEEQKSPEVNIPEKSMDRDGESLVKITTSSPLFTNDIADSQASSESPNLSSQSDGSLDDTGDEEKITSISISDVSKEDGMTTISSIDHHEPQKSEDNLQEFIPTSQTEIEVSDRVTEKIYTQPQEYATEQPKDSEGSERPSIEPNEKETDLDATKEEYTTESPYSPTVSVGFNEHSTISLGEHEVDKSEDMPESNTRKDDESITTLNPFVDEEEKITEKILTTDIIEQNLSTEKSKYDTLQDDNVQPSIVLPTEAQTVTEDKELENKDHPTSESFMDSPHSKVTNVIDNQYEKTTEISVTSHKDEMQDVQDDEKVSTEEPKQSTNTQFEKEFTAQDVYQTTPSVPKEHSQTELPLEIIPTSDESYISPSKSDSEIESNVVTTESIPVKEAHTVSDESQTVATKLVTEEIIMTTVAPIEQELLPTHSEDDVKEGEENTNKVTKTPEVMDTESEKYPITESLFTNKPLSITTTEVSLGDVTKSSDDIEEKPYTSKVPEQVDEQSTSSIVDNEMVTKLDIPESFVTTEKQYVTKSVQEEAPKVSEHFEDHGTSQSDIESITKQVYDEPSTTEKQYVTKSDQDEVHKYPEMIEEQSTSRIDTEGVEKVSEAATTEKQFGTKSDQEEIHEIPETIEEQSTSRIDTENVERVTEPATTENQFETKSDQEEVHKYPEIIEEQSTSRVDTEDVEKVSEPATTEKQFGTKSDQEEIHEIPETIEEQSTSRVDTEDVEKVSEPATTEKQFGTKSDQEEIHEIPETIEEQSTSRVDTEDVEKVSEPATTEKQFGTKSDQEEIHEIPETIEEQSTSRIDTENVERVTEPATTENQFETKSDQEEINKYPVIIEEQSTSRVDTEDVEKVSEPATTEKQFGTKSDQEEIHEIPETIEEQSTSGIDTELATKQVTLESYTTEKQYVTKSDQEETQKIPVYVDEQSTSQNDIESVTKFDESERATTEKQYLSEKDQTVSEVVEEQTTSRAEIVTKADDSDLLTTEKQYITQSEKDEIPTLSNEGEKENPHIDSEIGTKKEDGTLDSITTESSYEDKLDKEDVSKSPEIIDEQSNTHIDTESVTKLEDNESMTTEKQYMTQSDIEKTPDVIEEHSTSGMDIENVIKIDRDGVSTTEKQEVTEAAIKETSSDKVETDAEKTDKDIEDSEKTTSLPMINVQGSDLNKPLEDVTDAPQAEDSSTKIILTDISVSSVSDKIEDTTKSVMSDTVNEDNVVNYSTERNVESSTLLNEETATVRESENKTPGKPVTEEESAYSETTPYSVLLEEHTHSNLDDTSSDIPIEEAPTTMINKKQPERGDQIPDIYDSKDEYGHSTEKQIEQEAITVSYEKESSPDIPTVTIADFIQSSTINEKTGDDHYEDKNATSIQDEKITTPIVVPTIQEEERTTVSSILDKEFTTLRDIISSTERSEFIPSSSQDELTQDVLSSSTSKLQEESTHSPIAEDKEKPLSSSPIPSSSETPTKVNEPHDDEYPPDFPTTGTGGYGSEPDYVEEDQSFGPGTCRYGGKVYVSAQQIPRDDPCDFCFCFRSDIICLQQSCPPPIHGCHEEPIQGFCCPRYECPVSMATTVNVTTTTTTTTTTLPPHFLPHAYKGAAQRRGCQIKGHSYKVGEVVRASSGPCLHCTCGGDGQMKCDPKACTPEPMLRQMIAAAVSAKRRR